MRESVSCTCTHSEFLYVQNCQKCVLASLVVESSPPPTLTLEMSSENSLCFCLDRSILYAVPSFSDEGNLKIFRCRYEMSYEAVKLQLEQRVVHLDLSTWKFVSTQTNIFVHPESFGDACPNAGNPVTKCLEALSIFKARTGTHISTKSSSWKVSLLDCPTTRTIDGLGSHSLLTLETGSLTAMSKCNKHMPPHTTRKF